MFTSMAFLTFQSGQIPLDWTKALVTPIFKKGNRHLPENYRPVSLTSVLCKIFEHIVCSHIRDHLDEHKILTLVQHGFRGGHSCESQLLGTLHDLMGWRDRKVQVDMAVLDFAKAFDTVPHGALLGKLAHYGVDSDLNNWIRAFLTNRTQKVMVDGEVSDSVTVDSGVPQGTVLGPLLFLIHINDLPSNVRSTVRLFADDCLLYRAIRCAQDSLVLQQDLWALDRWALKWGMRFNVKKCNILRVCRSKTPISHMYTLGGQVLVEVDSAKYLGISISSELDWSPHVDSVTGKANNTLAFLRRNIKCCPQSLKELAYISLVRSQLEYAAATWDPHLVGHINKLERIQRRAARFVCNDYSYYSSVSSMLSTLGWTDLATRRKDLRLALFYKVVQGLVAMPTDDFLIKADSRTRAANPLKYRTLRTNTEVFRHSFFPRTVPDWNFLPTNIVEAPSIDAFKARLASTAAPHSRRAVSSELAQDCI